MSSELMSFKVGNRAIDLHGEISLEDAEFIMKRMDVFKISLFDVSYNYLISLQKVVHLYGDILTIYSTILEKIPNYDDITNLTEKVRMYILSVEFEINFALADNRFKWNSHKSYNLTMNKLASSILHATIAAFDKAYKAINAVDFFFSQFNNLKKLLIPCLYEKTAILLESMKKSLQLFQLNTMVDELNLFHDLNPALIKHLKKIEKVALGITRETSIMNLIFEIFDPILIGYTNVLLGKAILKREIAIDQCQLIKRRSVCIEASEHVVSILLTEEQSMMYAKNFLRKYMTWITLALFLLSCVVIRRLMIVLFG